MKRLHATSCTTFLLLLCGIASPAWAQIQAQQPPPTPGFGSGLQILTPHEGVDFTVFSGHFLQAVKRPWFAKMPQSAKMGDKGRVVVRLTVEKDGTLRDQAVTLEISSGKKDLDKAAVAAIRAAAPFEHLPDSFTGPNVELRCEFMYNLPTP